MKCNIGTMDRIMRISAGLILIGLAVGNVIGSWGWIGIVPLATGLIKFCPLYPILGLNSCGQKGSKK
ncbi:DUF2892 domain-containing protein [Polynucleobacter brandtiae]|uniref:Inner membrane protein YgaP-like transmembrane domain-containing protein n=1 Tax=Polynucleobacter brandtiae TaxID=1938816 RepID=A0A2M8VQU0_9BURK|nr:DUF2892 domain-containing protein [Polynucleobacter brandtiae]PJI79829.1 Protein of unknown function (DUF2892) [Polynucleobacter brandtiae]